MFTYGMHTLLTTLKGVVNVRTVESDVMAALGGRTCVAAGRTDKDVSALSQVHFAGPNRSIYAKDFSDIVGVCQHKCISLCAHVDFQIISSLYCDAFMQIISFSTYEELTVEELLSSMKSSPPCACGSLAVWEVVRAPKRFHALFSATWRRYIYLFPTQQGD